jgi:pimeloyl-ACP methyl ester carboxylesterase
VGSIEYTTVPERAVKELDNVPDGKLIAERLARFADVTPREPDTEGSTEVLDGVEFTHHFVDAPGDQETVRFHYVEAGAGEPIVFLHGLPDSWYQWHHQMAAFAATHRCIGVDLKGYGQSDKKPGDFRHPGAAAQLVAMLDKIGIDQFNLVSHDRGTVQADHIAASHPDRVLRYGRGEQHLYHLHPDIMRQVPLFTEAPWNGVMEDPRNFVIFCYVGSEKIQVPDDQMRRVIQEFSYPQTTHAVPRYFNSSTFRQEWIERRTRLLSAWRCPVMILQGYESRSQPREFYEQSRDYIPNAKDVVVRYMYAGRYWTMEAPGDVIAALTELLAM